MASPGPPQPTLLHHHHALKSHTPPSEMMSEHLTCRLLEAGHYPALTLSIPRGDKIPQVAGPPEVLPNPHHTP